MPLVVIELGFWLAFVAGGTWELTPAFRRHYKHASGGEDAPRFRYHPYRLYAYLPEIELWGCTTDRYGFIGEPSFTPQKRSSVYRIFLLGGSSAASYHAGANNLTISARLEHHLGPGYEVINAGVGGYASTQEFLFAALELVNYQPDMFVVLNGYNDWRNSLLANWTPHAHQRSIKYERDFNTLKSMQVVVYTQRKLQWLMPFTYEAVSWTVEIMTRTGPERKYTIPQSIQLESVDVYRQNIRNLAGLCAERGIELRVFLQPAFDSNKSLAGGEVKTLEASGYALEHKRKYFELLSQTTGVIDIRDLFINIPKPVFLDLVHYNKLGNDLIALTIKEEITSARQ